ncbi:MAG: hypothetical protein HY660_11235, partial [Armatimonadetes bacterium]|nr:hypothetical protein [Armatimonadota bacterium]
FSDVNFRRALAYAINYERLLPVWQGVATLAQGPFPATFRPWFAQSANVRYSLNPQKARTYFERAGFKTIPIAPPLQFEVMWQQGNRAQRDMADLIREDWAKVGIQLNIKETPLPPFREAVWTKKFDIGFVQAPLRYNDPDSLASLFYVSSEIRYRGFNPGYRNARVDEIVRLGRATINPSTRAQLYKEFQHIVTDEVAVLYLVNKLHAFAYRKEVEGIRWNPNYGPHFRAYEMNKNPNPK